MPAWKLRCSWGDLVSESGFSAEILDELIAQFDEETAAELMDRSDLIKYLEKKTRSADKGSKARGSFANLYAIYVLVEDYIANGYMAKKSYHSSSGAQYSALFERQRQLPFGEKLQNHGLNSRCNEEFAKFFPTNDLRPIIRDLESKRYWINEKLLLVPTAQGKVNIAPAVIGIIDRYVSAKRDAFQAFIADCDRLIEMSVKDPSQAVRFVNDLLRPNVDARIFEIASYAILRARYAGESVWFGDSRDAVEELALALYKTGRTNANDGGIDFVMRPLGRFFQVTETADVRKYFLDIDKVQRFPITFVVKTELDSAAVVTRIREFAEQSYPVTKVVDRYMDAIEEVITLPDLRRDLGSLADSGQLGEVIRELRVQAYVEFNLDLSD